MFKALAYDACGLVIVLILFYAPAMVPEELARANASQRILKIFKNGVVRLIDYDYLKFIG